MSVAKRSNLARWLLIALLVSAVASFLLLGGDQRLSIAGLKADLEALLRVVDTWPVAAALVFGFAYVAVVALSLPGAAAMTLAAGALFGLAEGVAIASIASTIGATLAMLAARFVARDWVKGKFPAAVAAVDKGIARDGWLYLLTLRLAPVFPFFLVNLAMGLTAMPVVRYALVTWAGALPGTIVYTAAGTALATIERPGDILSPTLIAAFLGLALLPIVGKAIAASIARRKALGKFRKPRKFDSNLIVIGAGSGGLVASLVAAELKAKVVLIERGAMGGDCLNTGCVPSKSLIRAARAAAEIRRAGEFGLSAGEPKVDFSAVMRRVQQSIDEIAPNDSAERFRGLGVDVRQASATLVDPWTVELDSGERLNAPSIVIATGADPAVPKLPGLETSGFVTSDTLWARLAELDQAPKRVAILGGGPIGCEIGQALARLGSKVTVIQGARRLIEKEDAEASALVETALTSDGVVVLTGRKAVAVEASAVKLDKGRAVAFDLLVVATGRKPRVTGLGLEAIGIDPEHIEIDARLRGPLSHILFAGDVADGPQFTHYAGHSGAITAINGLLGGLGRLKADTLIPRVTYTEPEVASVGLTDPGDREVEIVRYDLAELDRAVIDGAGAGFVKLVVAKGKDKVLGVTIVAPHAGELLMPWVMAIKRGIGLKAMLSLVYPYPTLSEASRSAAGEWRKAHKPARLLALAKRFHAWRRG